MKENLLKIVKQFLEALEKAGNPEFLEKFYDSQAIQIEYPNTLTKNLTKRKLKDLKEASEKGKQVISKQSYEILKSYVFENTVIIEAIWRGTLAIPLGKMSTGEEMKAYFAQFFEFKDGKIIHQRNYDCFEPFLN